jgi:hypothetical protein
MTESSSSSSSSYIIINHPEESLDRPVSIWSYSLFKFLLVVFVHLIHNSTLFLALCCYSFMLHIVAHLICIFLVSLQLVPLSPLAKKIIPFVVKCVCDRFHLERYQSFLSFCLRFEISFLWRINWRASAFYVFVLDDFWIQVVLQLFKIPSI